VIYRVYLKYLKYSLLKYVQSFQIRFVYAQFLLETLKERSVAGTRLVWRIILKWMLIKKSLTVCIGFCWLRMRHVSSLL
jgi:hypothetical protein